MNKTKLYKLSAMILVPVTIIIVIVFINFITNYDQHKKDVYISNEYDNMLEYASLHSEDIRKVSEILQEYRDFICEKDDYNLEELKSKLNKEEQNLLDDIQSIAPYDTGRLSLNTSESKEQFFYQWGFYDDDIRMVIIYVTGPMNDPLTFGWSDKLTKISDHLYVAMKQYYLK